MSLEKDIIKKYGAGVMIPASFILETPKKVIKFGPYLDIALSGGVPEGSWLLVSGPPKSGKTTSVLQLCANAQAMGKNIFYIDAEGRFKILNLGIHNLDADKLMLIRSTPERQYSAEDFLNMGIQIIKDPSNFGCILVVDSASALCPSDEVGEDVTGSKRVSTPKILSNFVKKIATIVPVMNSVVVIIQHLIANTSGYGYPWMEDGGVRVQYQADIKIRCKKGEPWLDGDKRIGQTTNWEVITSALGPPGAKVDSYIRYGYGIDDITETMLIASDIGIITKGGSWYTLPDGQKFQGQEKLYSHLKNNKDSFEQIYKKVSEFKI